MGWITVISLAALALWNAYNEVKLEDPAVVIPLAVLPIMGFCLCIVHQRVRQLLAKPEKITTDSLPKVDGGEVSGGFHDMNSTALRDPSATALDPAHLSDVVQLDLKSVS